MNLRRPPGAPPLVVAHRANSLAALATVRDVDLVELDVVPGLVVAHDPGDDGPSLAEALDVLAGRDVGIHVDLKLPGYEQAVLEAIDERRLRERVLVSTAYARVARRVRALAPELPVAIGYPRDRYRVSRFAWPGAVTRPGAAALRAAMPARIPPLLAWAQADVLALHHTLCSRAAVAAAHRRGAPVFVWTVDDPAARERFSSLGVDAVVTDRWLH
ncbi:MAG TPA: glycerophosphodiester phosphodiesterase [Gaiellaceae bacterium]|nr:glycerophosphodiester phosphodiesterase [Gaiellaceae bacterium]